MKIRIFKRLVDGVFDVRIHTEDWSENDRILMKEHGEPDINLGGTFTYDEGSSESSGEYITVFIEETYARIMSESPFTHKFDSRDYGSITAAKGLASAWSSRIEDRIAEAVLALRDKGQFFTTEEVTEY